MGVNAYQRRGHSGREALPGLKRHQNLAAMSHVGDGICLCHHAACILEMSARRMMLHGHKEVKLLAVMIRLLLFLAAYSKTSAPGCVTMP